MQLLDYRRRFALTHRTVRPAEFVIFRIGVMTVQPRGCGYASRHCDRAAQHILEAPRLLSATHERGMQKEISERLGDPDPAKIAMPPPISVTAPIGSVDAHGVSDPRAQAPFGAVDISGPVLAARIWRLPAFEWMPGIASEHEQTHGHNRHVAGQPAGTCGVIMSCTACAGCGGRASRLQQRSGAGRGPPASD